MRLKSLFTSLALFASLLTVSAQPVKWVTYGEALNLAVKEWKPIYIYFFSDRCPYCSMMEDTFSNQSVMKVLSTGFVAVRVNIAEQPDLASTYGIPGTPSHVFLYPNGSLIGGVAGYRDPESFLAILHKVLSIIGPASSSSEARSSPSHDSEMLSAFASFTLGLITPLTPCILPMLPVVHLISSKSGRKGILLFSLGFMFTYSILGIIASGFLLFIRNTIEPAVHFLLLLSGLVLTVNQANKLFSALLGFLTNRLAGIVRSRSTLILGGLSVFLWGPCLAPMAGAALATAVIVASPVFVYLSTVLFALGFSTMLYILLIAMKKARGLATKRRALKSFEKLLGSIMVFSALLYFSGLIKF
ncbi:MAG: DUF255 domain-containing protein [Thermofilaceae archaeon]